MTTVLSKPNVAELTKPLPATIRAAHIDIPTGVVENLKYREKMLRVAESPEARRGVMDACRKSFVFWCLTFAYTRKAVIITDAGVEMPNKNKNHPFILYPVQIEGATKMLAAMEKGTDIGVRKSRQMGISWLICALVLWLWLFRPGFTAILVSRVEDMIDRPGDPIALFYKLDYMLQRLPAWMKPPNTEKGKRNRTHMRLTNPINSAVITGQATTAHAGRGGNCDVMVLDEFCAVQNGKAIRDGTDDVGCRWVNGTPVDGSEFNRWMTDDTLDVVEFLWYRHPEKAKGVYVVHDESTQKWDIRSPWHDLEEQSRTELSMLENVHASFVVSGNAFMDTTALDRMIVACQDAPVHMDLAARGDLSYEQAKRYIKARDPKMAVISTMGNGNLYWWGELVRGRPPQNQSYIIGVDVSEGRGQSNSVASVRSITTGEKVGELVTAVQRTDEFAATTVALALWVGGMLPYSTPYIAWEVNNPGIDYGRVMVESFAYPYIHYENRKSSRHADKRRYGWFSTRDKKLELFGRYRQALLDGSYKNPSAAALREMRGIVRYEGGGIGPAEFAKEPNALKAHADRVTADALTCILNIAPKQLGRKKNRGARRFDAMVALSKQRKRERFNFGVSCGV